MRAGPRDLAAQGGTEADPPAPALPSAIDGPGGTGEGAAVAHSVGVCHRPRCRLLRHGRIVRLHPRPLRRLESDRRAKTVTGRARSRERICAQRRWNLVPSPSRRPGRRREGAAPGGAAAFSPGEELMNLAWISLAALIIASTRS